MHKMAEEIKLLKSMLKERNARIKSLSAQVMSLQTEIENVHIQTAEAQRLLEEDAKLHKQNLFKYNMEEEAEGMKMKQLESEMKQSTTLYEYVQLLKNAANKSASVQDSTYVIRLQSQLMKSMHSMGMLDNQLKLYQNQCSSMAKSLKDEIGSMVDKKSMSEMQLMNELGHLHGEMRDMEEKYRKKIEEKRAALAEVEEELAEYIDSDDESDDDESDDDHSKDEDEEEPDAAVGENAIDEEIEKLTLQLEALATENESMEEHLKSAIAEKDEILAQLKEDKDS